MTSVPKYLVTGAGGQVGRAVVNSAPANVTMLARSHKDLDVANAHAIVSYIRRHRPDVIINMGESFSRFVGSWYQPIEF